MSLWNVVCFTLLMVGSGAMASPGAVPEKSPLHSSETSPNGRAIGLDKNQEKWEEVRNSHSERAARERVELQSCKALTENGPEDRPFRFIDDEAAKAGRTATAMDPELKQFVVVNITPMALRPSPFVSPSPMPSPGVEADRDERVVRYSTHGDAVELQIRWKDGKIQGYAVLQTCGDGFGFADLKAMVEHISKEMSDKLLALTDPKKPGADQKTASDQKEKGVPPAYQAFPLASNSNQPEHRGGGRSGGGGGGFSRSSGGFSGGYSRPSSSSTYRPSTSSTYRPSSSSTYRPSSSSTYRPSSSSTYRPSTSSTYRPSTSNTYRPSTSGSSRPNTSGSSGSRSSGNTGRTSSTTGRTGGTSTPRGSAGNSSGAHQGPTGSSGNGGARTATDRSAGNRYTPQAGSRRTQTSNGFIEDRGNHQVRFEKTKDGNYVAREVKTSRGTTVYRNDGSAAQFRSADGRRVSDIDREGVRHVKDVKTGKPLYSERDVPLHSQGSNGPSQRVQRTYTTNNRTVIKNYNIYNNHGYAYHAFVPTFYDPFVYDYFYNPWVSPFGYRWWWAGDPWYGYYGSYFHPYPTYYGPSYWLTDYLLASQLANQYANAAAGSQAPPQHADNSAQLTQEIKDQVRAEVERTLHAEKAHQVVPVTELLKNPQTMFSVGDIKDVLIVGARNPDGSAAKCTLSPGDFIHAAQAPQEGAPVAVLEVAASKSGSCPIGTRVMVNVVDDLQRWHNQFVESVNQGMNEYANRRVDGNSPPLRAVADEAVQPPPSRPVVSEASMVNPPPVVQPPAAEAPQEPAPQPKKPSRWQRFKQWLRHPFTKTVA